MEFHDIMDLEDSEDPFLHSDSEVARRDNTPRCKKIN